MKTENELILMAVDIEIEKIKKEISKQSERFERELIKNNLEYCRGYLTGKKELIDELENYLNLKRSKRALMGLDSSYDVATDTNFSADDIPF